MKIKVRYFTTLRELAGLGEEELEMNAGSTLHDLIDEIIRKYGGEALDYLYVKSTGKLDPTIKYLINGVNSVNIHGQKLGLKEGDVVAIIPPIGGGI